MNKKCILSFLRGNICFFYANPSFAAKLKLANKDRKAVFSIKGYQNSFVTFTHIDMFKRF